MNRREKLVYTGVHCHKASSLMSRPALLNVPPAPKVLPEAPLNMLEEGWIASLDSWRAPILSLFLFPDRSLLIAFGLPPLSWRLISTNRYEKFVSIGVYQRELTYVAYSVVECIVVSEVVVGSILKHFRGIGLVTFPFAVVPVSRALPAHCSRLAPIFAADSRGMSRLDSVVSLVASFNSPVSGPLLTAFTICTDLSRFTFLITCGGGGPFEKER
jgi:hypothetical protein